MDRTHDFWKYEPYISLCRQTRKAMGTDERLIEPKCQECQPHRQMHVHARTRAMAIYTW